MNVIVGTTSHVGFLKKALECTVADERLPSPIAESTISAAKSLLSWINEAQNHQKRL